MSRRSEGRGRRKLPVSRAASETPRSKERRPPAGAEASEGSGCARLSASAWTGEAAADGVDDGGETLLRRFAEAGPEVTGSEGVRFDPTTSTQVGKRSELAYGAEVSKAAAAEVSRGGEARDGGSDGPRQGAGEEGAEAGDGTVDRRRSVGKATSADVSASGRRTIRPKRRKRPPSGPGELAKRATAEAKRRRPHVLVSQAAETKRGASTTA